MNRKILIMGGSYFIGKSIAQTFSQFGDDVYVLNRGSRPLNDSRIKELVCDREDQEQLKKVLNDHHFEVVIDVSATNKVHLQYLVESLHTDRLASFIFISSSAVYDVENLSIPYKVSDPLGENSYWGDYGTNKIEAEAYLKTQLTNSQIIILRPPYVYGENNYAQRESFIFDHLVHHQPIIIPNQGDTLLQFIYTHDLAKICLDLSLKSLDHLSIYNVGNKKPLSIKDWILCLGKAAKKEPIFKEFDYLKHGYTIRDFFPFHDYDNVLEINIDFDETQFIEGAQIAFDWYQKTPIEFKKNVRENEEEIINKYF